MDSFTVSNHRYLRTIVVVWIPAKFMNMMRMANFWTVRRCGSFAICNNQVMASFLKEKGYIVKIEKEAGG